MSETARYRRKWILVELSGVHIGGTPGDGGYQGFARKNHDENERNGNSSEPCFPGARASQYNTARERA